MKVYMGQGASALRTEVRYGDSENTSEESILRGVQGSGGAVIANPGTGGNARHMEIKRTDEIQVVYTKDGIV